MDEENKIVIISIFQGWEDGTSWLSRETEETVEEIAESKIVPEYEYEEFVKNQKRWGKIDISQFKQGWFLAFYQYWWQFKSEKEKLSSLKWFKDLKTNELLSTENAIERYIENKEYRKLYDKWRREH